MIWQEMASIPWFLVFGAAVLGIVFVWVGARYFRKEPSQEERDGLGVPRRERFAFLVLQGFFLLLVAIFLVCLKITVKP